ncbi:MAG: hydrogenase formation protein HypD [Lachnospiraceae bacterium]|nr:hydrogenase formation protein HypD [Lachnospiraceae bacterium]
MDLASIREYLKSYDGPDMQIMEVCGSHTGAIAKNGIPGLLSPKIHLLSGPGCPVCVTPSSYVDKLIELSMNPKNCIVTFGDLLRVPGSTKRTLSSARGEGARVEMVYSPMDTIDLALKDPETDYIFAAVGFETTTPVYALLVDEVIRRDLRNVKLLTAIKTMPEVIRYLCESGAPIDAFIAPGHVSVVTGTKIYEPIAEEFRIPFGVAGFEGKELLAAIYGIVRSYGKGRVMNFYPSVVREDGNPQARAMIDKYFIVHDCAWRGMGIVPGSGKVLREEYRYLDAGSIGLDEDHKANPACSCDRVLMGKIRPYECPLFGKICNPLNPQGACMVSTEGSCFSYYSNHRTDG